MILKIRLNTINLKGGGFQPGGLPKRVYCEKQNRADLAEPYKIEAEPAYL
jgi:hypothetical protein